MDSTPILSAVVAVIIIILIFLGVTHLWYNKSSSWQSFNASSVTYDWPQWSSTSKNGASDLRFRNCIFTVTLGDGKTTQSLDVTNILNGMALQQKSPVITTTTITSGSSKYQPTMTLVRPLNPFSFVINGFNDPTTLANVDIGAYPWCTANCVNSSKTPTAIANPAVSTLTGEYRTL